MEVAAADDPAIAASEQQAWFVRVAGADGAGTFSDIDRFTTGSAMHSHTPIMKTLRRVCELMRHVGL
jgi:hypothetical protein